VPVYEGRREQIAGIVNVIDVLAHRADGANPAQIMRSPVFIQMGSSVAEALIALQQAGQQMAVVTEGDAAVGLVTIKDLVEEIVGELSDW
jgi:CBS domain containing-hemolysin-like protein